MAADTINEFVGSGTAAEMAAYVPDPPSPVNPPDCGFVYFNTTDGLLYAWDGAAWVATGGGGGSGTVTNTGTLTDHALIVGNGGVDVSALASLGTATTVLHGNAAGDPTFAAVSLTADVSGDLPFANLAPASAASKLLGRGDSGAGDYQEITIGANLTMTGTTLSASGGASANPITVGVTVDGGGSAITTGIKGYIQCPVTGTITKWTLLGDQSGSVEFDVFLDAFGAALPTTSIVAAAPPALTADVTGTDSTLTGWSTTVTAGDVFGFEVVSAATLERVTLQIEVAP